MPAVIRLDFAPAVTILGLAVRLETIALAGAALVALVLAALGAGRMRARDGDGASHLRRDDLILIAFGAIPGAVIGGRIGYGIVHLDFYRANPSAFLDPGQGSATLTFAVVLGTVTGLAVARLLDAPLGRWLHVASVPMLVGLGLGKLAMTAGGAGQGRYDETLGWATAYVHSGTWLSANPADPAVPSQALEGGLVLLAAVAMLFGPVLLRFRLRRWWRIARPGWSERRAWSALQGARRFLTAVCVWAAVRFVAVFTWRDATVLGPLRAEHLLLLAVGGGCLAVLVLVTLADVRRRRRERAAAVPASPAAGRADA